MFSFPSNTWISKILKCGKLHHKISDRIGEGLFYCLIPVDCGRVYTGEMNEYGNAWVTPNAGLAQAHLQTALNIYSSQKWHGGLQAGCSLWRLYWWGSLNHFGKQCSLSLDFKAWIQIYFWITTSLCTYVTLNTLLLGSSFLICKMEMINYRNKVIIGKALKICLCALKLGVSAM